MYAEPSPYCLPPVNLFRWRVLLQPLGADPREPVTGADVSVRATDVPEPPGGAGVARKVAAAVVSTPISWADKPFALREEAPDRP